MVDMEESTVTMVTTDMVEGDTDMAAEDMDMDEDHSVSILYLSIFPQKQVRGNHLHTGNF